MSKSDDNGGMKPTGDIIKMSDLRKPIKRESRLMLAPGEIHDLTTLECDDVSYWPRGLVQCTLPHSNPGNVRAYVRRSGNYFLMIEPGTKIGRKTGELGNHGFPRTARTRAWCAPTSRAKSDSSAAAACFSVTASRLSWRS